MFVTIFSILATALLIYLLFESYRKIRKQIYSKSKVKYEQLCPDYWEIVKQEKDNNGKTISIECKNIHKIGKCGVSDRDTFIFDDEIFLNPETASAAKCRWSKLCNATWQGYDNLCS